MSLCDPQKMHFSAPACEGPTHRGMANEREVMTGSGEQFLPGRSAGGVVCVVDHGDEVQVGDLIPLQ